MNQEEYIDFDPKIPRHKSFITKYLILIIVFIYLLEASFNALYNDKAIIYLGAKWNEGINNGQLWRLFTYSFLHGNLIHLLLNIVALNAFGKEVESFYGSWKFLIIYSSSVWGGGLASYYFSSGLAIGASGGLFGIIGSLIIYFYKQKDFIEGAIFKFKSMYTLVIINIILGFIIPKIDNFGHLGGLLTGLITSWLIAPQYKLYVNENSGILSVVEIKHFLKNTSLIFLNIILLILITFICLHTKKGN